MHTLIIRLPPRYSGHLPRHPPQHGGIASTVSTSCHTVPPRPPPPPLTLCSPVCCNPSVLSSALSQVCQHDALSRSVVSHTVVSPRRPVCQCGTAAAVDSRTARYASLACITSDAGFKSHRDARSRYAVSHSHQSAGERCPSTSDRCGPHTSSTVHGGGGITRTIQPSTHPSRLGFAFRAFPLHRARCTCRYSASGRDRSSGCDGPYGYTSSGRV